MTDYPQIMQEVNPDHTTMGARYVVTGGDPTTITLPTIDTITTGGNVFMTNDGNTWRVFDADAAHTEVSDRAAPTLAQWVDQHIRHWYDLGIFDKPVLYVPSKKAKAEYLASVERTQHVPVVEVILTNFVTLRIGNNPPLRYIHE